MKRATTNRRRQARVRRQLPVVLELRGRSFEAVTGNLSSTGLLLRSSVMLLAGTAITGLLRIDNDAVRFQALIRWSRSGSQGDGPGPVHTLGLEFLETPAQVYLDFLHAVAGEGEFDEPPTFASDRNPTTPGRGFRTPPPIPAEPVPSKKTLPAYVAGEETPTGRTHLTHILAERELAQASRAVEPREEFPTAEHTNPYRFGLSPGLLGRAEGSAKSAHQRAGGTSPLAVSAAATLFERAAVQAITPALIDGMQTIGVSMAVELVIPAEVTLGGRLEATATLTEVSSDRMVHFDVELSEGDRVIARGEHWRMLVDG